GPSGGPAVEAAVRALQQSELDLALTGAIDLAGDVRMLLAAEHHPVGEGAAALVLKRLADADRDGDRVYAVIRGVGSASAADESLRPADSGSEVALRNALADSAVEADGIGLHERDEIGASTGHAGAASFAAALVRTCLALHHELLPGPAPRFWLTNTSDGLRRAVVGAVGTGGNCVAAVLEEYRSGNIAESACAIDDTSERFFALEADTAFGLSEEVERLDRVARCDSLAKAAHRWRASAPRRGGAAPGRAVGAPSTGALRDQIPRLRQHLAERPDAATGSAERFCYTPRPLGRSGKIAFVFPGSGNHFAGMGRELAVRWPHVMRRQQRESRRLKDQFAPDRFWIGPA